MTAQESVTLTKEQSRAFNRLKKAVKACNDSNVYFYQVLDKVNALNGDNVEDVDNLEYTNIEYEDERNLQYLSYPSVIMACGFADDTHVVILKDAGK